MGLAKLNISQKLPIYIISIAALAVFATSALNIQNAYVEQYETQEYKLLTVQGARANGLNNYLSSIEEDLSSLAYSEYVRGALLDFMVGWDEIKKDGDPKTILQDLYINKNPHEEFHKHELDYATDGSLYSQIHKRYHPWFRHFLNLRGYYDIFLFSPNGDLVYTVFKELDYATNLNNGEYSDTDLGKAFRAARDNPQKDHQAFFDFKRYKPSKDVPASFISQPILDDNGALAGVLVFQMPIGRINSIMGSENGLGRTGEAYIVGKDYLMRNNSRFSKDGEDTILSKELHGETADLALNYNGKAEEAMNNRGTKTIERDGKKIVSAYGTFDFNGARWAIMTEMDEEEVLEPIYEMIKYSVMISVLILCVIGGVSFAIARSITRPISGMTGALKELADGNLNVEVPYTDRKDELGDMASAMQVLKETSNQAQKLQEQQEKLKEENLAERKKMMQELAAKFDADVGGAISELASAAEQLQSSAQQMEITASQTQDSSASVASAAEETSVNVSTVSSATEEMAASAKEIATQVNDVAMRASQATKSANETSNKVDELNKLVGNIGEVVTAIKDIAEQTNLLALNATIEAARAGEAGKGFAVVADEVKKLASETASKTEEIENRIVEIQGATESSVEAMQLIIKNISDIDHSSSGAASAAEEQNSVIAEITRSINEVSEAAKQVASVIGSVQGAASETSQASQGLRNSATDISSLSSTLQEAVSGFLKQIREN